jgi:hypothetical protein
VPPETHYAKSGAVNIAYQAVGDGPLDLVLVWTITDGSPVRFDEYVNAPPTLPAAPASPADAGGRHGV